MENKIFANGNKVLTTEEKTEMKNKLEGLFAQVLDTLGYDRENDHNIKDTPKRVAKMYVEELLKGNFNEPPKITTFPNAKSYDEMIISGPISVKSLCSHHLVSITGEAFLGYVPGERVVGLSKLARIVQFFMRRPQIQEEMTQQIINYVDDLLKPKGVIVVIKATHMCMTIRGVEEPNALMTTSAVRGAFATNPETRKEFFDLIKG